MTGLFFGCTKIKTTKGAALQRIPADNLDAMGRCGLAKKRILHNYF